MSLLVPVGADPITLDPGMNTILISGIAAVQPAGGLGASIASTNPRFGVQPRGDGGSRTLNLHARGTGGVPTTLSVSLYGSSDGGATWNLIGSASPLVATGAATDAQITNLVAGMMYQLLVTTLTLGASATAVSVDGALS